MNHICCFCDRHKWKTSWLHQTEGEQTKSATQVVAEVLGKNTRKNQFLHNVGIQIVQPRSSAQNATAELQAEKRENAELRAIVNSQRAEMDELSKKVQES